MTGEQTQTWFQIQNTWTSIYGANEDLLRLLDIESKYPSPTVEMMKWGGVENPESPGWDGWIRLLRRPKIKAPYFPTGLVPRLVRVARKFGYEIKLDDQRIRHEFGFPEPAPTPIVDRGYQIAAVDAAVMHGRGILDCPPRSGKTRMMCEIQRQIALPTIWIAPTDRIVDQTFRVLEGFFSDNYAMHLVGTKELAKAMNTNVVVCTAATAGNLPPEFYATRAMIVTDEWHHSASKTYQNIFKMCDHVFYRFGMTGTNFRSGEDGLAMHGLLSQVIFKVSSQYLLDQGHLIPTRVAFLPVPGPKLRGVDSKFNTGHGKFGIHEHDLRNEMAAQAALQLHNAGRRVLILVGTKKQGYRIKQLIEVFLPRAPAGARCEAVEFVSTDKPRPKQKEILESYLSGEEVKIVIGTSLLGEGVDLPSVDALVYARGEKAEVSLTQNAYRVCTALAGKREAVIVDFADQHHRKLLKHSHSRLDVYHREATFDVNVLQDSNHLLPWLQGVA